MKKNEVKFHALLRLRAHLMSRCTYLEDSLLNERALLRDVETILGIEPKKTRGKKK